jgi:two-component system, chemotaxis family, CheB/CheR fusion protein
LAEQHDYLQSIVDTVRDPMLVLDRELRIISANRSFNRALGVSLEATEGVLAHEIGDVQ